MTRFLIAKQVGPDAYRTIAGLCDGYLEHTGVMLLEHYNTPDRVDKLLDLGDIECLYKDLDWPEGVSYQDGQDSKAVTVAFGRDHGETGTEATILSLKQLDSPISWNEFIYIFMDTNQWAYFEIGMSEYGLLDLRDGVNRLMEAPPPKYITTPPQTPDLHTKETEEVYIYKNRKGQSASKGVAADKRLKEYLSSRGYENGGSISISAPMSECGWNYDEMLKYCDQHGITRIVIDNLKALDDRPVVVNMILKHICDQGIKVEVVESGAVFDESYFAPQEEGLTESQGGMQCQM